MVLPFLAVTVQHLELQLDMFAQREFLSWPDPRAHYTRLRTLHITFHTHATANIQSAVDYILARFANSAVTTPTLNITQNPLIQHEQLAVVAQQVALKALSDAVRFLGADFMPELETF